MRSINTPPQTYPLAPSARAILSRPRPALEIPSECVSIWEFCDPNTNAMQDAQILAWDAKCVALGAAGYVPTSTTTNYRPTINYQTHLTLNMPGCFGDIYATNSGPQFVFNPILGTTPDYGVGITATNGQWHHLNFRVNSPNGPLGNTELRPQALLDLGYFTAWGSKNLTCAVDLDSFYQDGAVVLLPGVGFAPGWIPFEIVGTCTADFITCYGGKIGLKNNCPAGHVNVTNSTLMGWQFAEWYAINGQDYIEYKGGRHACMAAMAVGNTGSVGVVGGFIGNLFGVHYDGCAFGIMQVQDDPAHTLSQSGSAGFQGGMYSFRGERIGEQVFHLYTPKDGISSGSDFACTFVEPFVQYADFEDPTYNLPPSMLTVMGITHGQYRGGELGSVNRISTTMDFGDILITDAGKDSISRPDFGGFKSVTNLNTKFANSIPMTYSNGSPAKRGELWDAQDWLPKGNLLQNPELNITTLSTTLSDNPSFMLANGGSWDYEKASFTAAVSTLSGWLATGSDNLVVNEGLSKAIGPNTRVFKFSNNTTDLKTLVIYGITSPGGHQGMSVQMFGSAGSKFDLNDSNGTGILTTQAFPPNDIALPLKMAAAVAENVPMVSGRSMGRIIIFVNPQTVVYIANVMANWGKPAPYNPNPTPSFASGFEPLRGAGVVPAGLTSGAVWCDTSAGNSLKLVI